MRAARVVVEITTPVSNWSGTSGQRRRTRWRGGEDGDDVGLEPARARSWRSQTWAADPLSLSLALISKPIDAIRGQWYGEHDECMRTVSPGSDHAAHDEQQHDTLLVNWQEIPAGPGDLHHDGATTPGVDGEDVVRFGLAQRGNREPRQRDRE
jgi:hypothetical protein